MQREKTATTEVAMFTNDAHGYLKWESLYTTCDILDTGKPVGFLQSAAQELNWEQPKTNPVSITG